MEQVKRRPGIDLNTTLIKMVREIEKHDKTLSDALLLKSRTLGNVNFDFVMQ